ncbi:proteophosphoglycan ppg4 [Leptomonas pyrrhocoris]|uniref:Proteophosphoglycan ppg4 n=1 Tax=Leptomonas pyrrhocoris TaxID=157538 RepID=A0A0M9FR14_LEPPY|nr:proteophosphoglycan ppg4 [Leptomonas pyrrhocoris]KPA74189.1 proteophosphoglycan ppg4 [Leptomonas pyrrhocoris]|eukprot:XP_015652628.1 proteophosphoglycan ppg4 [Leptomonas pyrrhocoris]
MYMCNGKVPFYNDTQIEDTRNFLMPLLEPIFPLSRDCPNFCAWECVSCSSSGVEVTIHGSSMFGNLPDVPKLVTGANVKVTKLDFSGEDGLLGQLPSSWSTLKGLKFVSVVGTRINGPLPDAWSALTNLEYVDFSWSLIAGTMPESWCALTKLQVFRANGLSMHASLPSSWAAMSALTEFDMRNCGLTGTLPGGWSALSNLKTLLLDRSNLEGSIPESYGFMRSIVTVNLQGNTFCGCLPTAWTTSSSTVRVTADAAVTAANCSTANSCFPLSSSNRVSSSSAPPSAASSSSSSVPSGSSSSSSAPPSSTSASASSSSSSVPSGSSSSSSVPYYSPNQVASTRIVISSLFQSLQILEQRWPYSNYCTWTGVECYAEGMVVSLSNRGLVGTLPSLPSDLNVSDVVLTKLDVSENPNITGTIPIGWVLLPNLLDFNVYGCGLSGSLPGE